MTIHERADGAPQHRPGFDIEWAWLVAKTVVAMAFAAAAILSIAVAALVTGTAHLSLVQILVVAVVMVVGAIPFRAIGLYIGARVSGSTAPAIVNVVFLPMLWLSGLFVPLPSWLEKLVVIWPAFQLNQVAMGTAGIDSFSFVPPLTSAALLLGVAVLFGGLAISPSGTTWVTRSGTRRVDISRDGASPCGRGVRPPARREQRRGPWSPPSAVTARTAHGTAPAPRWRAAST